MVYIEEYLLVEGGLELGVADERVLYDGLLGEVLLFEARRRRGKLRLRQRLQLLILSTKVYIISF